MPNILSKLSCFSNSLRQFPGGVLHSVQIMILFHIKLRFYADLVRVKNSIVKLVWITYFMLIEWCITQYSAYKFTCGSTQLNWFHVVQTIYPIVYIILSPSFSKMRLRTSFTTRPTILLFLFIYWNINQFMEVSRKKTYIHTRIHTTKHDYVT